MPPLPPPANVTAEYVAAVAQQVQLAVVSAVVASTVASVGASVGGAAAGAAAAAAGSAAAGAAGGAAAGGAGGAGAGGAGGAGAAGGAAMFPLVLGAQRFAASDGLACKKSELQSGVAGSMGWTTGELSLLSEDGVTPGETTAAVRRMLRQVVPEQLLPRRLSEESEGGGLAAVEASICEGECSRPREVTKLLNQLLVFGLTLAFLLLIYGMGIYCWTRRINRKYYAMVAAITARDAEFLEGTGLKSKLTVIRNPLAKSSWGYTRQRRLRLSKELGAHQLVAPPSEMHAPDLRVEPALSREDEPPFTSRLAWSPSHAVDESALRAPTQPGRGASMGSPRKRDMSRRVTAKPADAFLAASPPPSPPSSSPMSSSMASSQQQEGQSQSSPRLATMLPRHGVSFRAAGFEMTLRPVPPARVAPKRVAKPPEQVRILAASPPNAVDQRANVGAGDLAAKGDLVVCDITDRVQVDAPSMAPATETAATQHQSESKKAGGDDAQKTQETIQEEMEPEELPKFRPLPTVLIWPNLPMLAFWCEPSQPPRMLLLERVV